MSGYQKDHPRHSYGYDEEDIEWFQQFNIEPVKVKELREKVNKGQVLETLDIPGYLNRKMVAEPDTGLVFYRLIQLFGTPNIPGFEAGAEYQHNREERTWQYLFKVIYDPEDENEERREFLLSIYDYQTDISTGLSAWRQPEGDVEQVLTPVEDIEELDAEELQENRIPDEEFLEGVVQLVLNMIEEPVPATFKDRWI